MPPHARPVTTNPLPSAAALMKVHSPPFPRFDVSQKSFREQSSTPSKGSKAELALFVPAGPARLRLRLI